MDIAKALKRILAASRWIFGPAAAVFLLIAAISARGVFEDVFRHALIAPFSIAVLTWTLLHLLAPLFAWVVLNETGTPVAYRTALGIHVNRLPARYLPGGIWHTVSRVIDFGQLGANRAQLSALVLVENVLPPSAALLLGGLCMAAIGRMPVLSVAAVVGGVVPLVFARYFLKHRSMLNQLPFSRTAYLHLVSLALIFWCLAAIAFCFYWSAFPNVDEELNILEIAGTYLLAWVSGFLMIFTPQGIGVFEATTAALLKGTIPFAGIVVLAAGFRAAVLLADMLAYGTLWLIRAGGRLPKAPKDKPLD